jgi:signal recognition particle receptor subunit beta
MRGAHLAILVLDLTEPASLAALSQWLELTQSTLPKTTPIFVVANKTDLADQIRVSDDDIRTFAAEHDFPVFNTSAVTGDGIEQLFVAAAETVRHAAVPLEIRELRREPVVERPAGGCC